MALPRLASEEKAGIGTKKVEKRKKKYNNHKKKKGKTPAVAFYSSMNNRAIITGRFHIKPDHQKQK